MSGDLVVDTDCGSDDAMALMLALGGQRAHRLGAITCCFGNTTVDNVRRNVHRVLQACGRTTEIPVFSGFDHPLVRATPDPLAVRSSVEVHGADGFGDRICPRASSEQKEGETCSAEEEGAVDALLRMSSDKPGEMTVVALAPLTNIAAAHRKDEGFTARLKGIVCLGGNYTGLGNVTEWAEFNFFSDPEAAQVVLTESRCPIRLVPWETCLRNGMEWVDFRAMLASPGKKAELLRDATSTVARYCENEGDPAFLDCDVLAMAAALWPECVTDAMSVAAVGVVCGDERRGLCVVGGGANSKEGGPVIEIVKGFDEAMLKELRRDMVAETRPLE